MKCGKCGYECDGKFCSNCGSLLDYEKIENIGSKDNWTKVCPVCKSGSLHYELKKSLFGLISNKTFTCSKCNAQFKELIEKYQLISVSDISNIVWKNYAGKLLFSDEWQRISNGGLSDEKQKEVDRAEYYSRLRSGEVSITGDPNCPVILKMDEEHIISIPGISLNEPKSVRITSRNYGGGFDSVSESHEEIRNIDNGTFTLTSRRIIFSGLKKSINIGLLKIVSIVPYSDGIAIYRENKEKTEYFLNIPRINLDIRMNEKEYSEPVSSLMLAYMIEGLINRRNNPSLSEKNISTKSLEDNCRGMDRSLENKRSTIQLERNLKGKELEKIGDVDGAIKLYENNAAEGCEGNHPYDRLAIIYRRKKQYLDEIRILERAIFVFENYASPGRGDVSPKLEKFRERLEKAKKLEEKNK